MVMEDLKGSERGRNGVGPSNKTYNQLPVNSINKVDWLKGRPKQTISSISLHSKEIQFFISFVSWN